MTRKDSNPVKESEESLAVSDSTGKSTPAPPKRKALFGCVRRREGWVLTWRGVLALVILCFLAAITALHTIHPFLSPNHPLNGGIVVVEGWAPDYALKAAAAEFTRSTSDKLYVTGGPLENGGPLSEYKTYAQLGAATLCHMGLATNQVQAVPAPLVQQDRTYNSALALRNHLEQHGVSHPVINLISIGPHARRSRLLYEKAFGKGTRIGIIALPPDDYDPKHWWRSSPGVRVVLSETFAYCYVRLLFRPKTEAIAP